MKTFFSKKNLFVSSWLVLSLWEGMSEACTVFTIKSSEKNPSVFVSRSLEFAVELDSKLVVHKKGGEHQTGGTDLTKSVTWKDRYDYLSLDALNYKSVIEGMNEKGLTASMLWFADAGYPSGSQTNMNMLDFGSWILGSFASVEEVKEAITKQKIQVWAPYIKELKTVLPVHYSVHDASGRSIVIEWVKGQQFVYDNPVGVLTNTPDFNWHIENLKNYSNLKTSSPTHLTLGDVSLRASAVGHGFQGLPGSYSPSDRFVRAAFFSTLSQTPQNAREALVTSTHIMNSFDIPKGLVTVDAGGKILNNHTQWITIKDLTNKKMYFRSYDNPELQSMSLSEINLSDGDRKELMRVSEASAGATIRALAL